jgi:pimeloyl-ACP methyl ester carboxylesterase
MTVGQQARDAGAIIKAMGSDKAIIFWSSGGGITGLELAAVKPEVIDFLILHGTTSDRAVTGHGREEVALISP